MSDELDKLRQEIAAIDARLLALIAARLRLARRVGQHKHQQHIAITDGVVEELILQQNLHTGHALQLPASLVRSLTALLITYATRAQQEEGVLSAQGGKLAKKNLRTELRRARDALSPALRQQYSQAICAALAGDCQCAAFPQVFFYAAINSEPDLTALAARWSATKKLALPVVTGSRLVFCRWHIDDELVRGECGIPIPPTRYVLTPTADTLVLLPCVALDHYGNRLGYGGGHYDRFLAAHPAVCTVGVCYRRFLSASRLPTCSHDHRLRYLVTETGLRRAKIV